jgi:hypothetical protein
VEFKRDIKTMERGINSERMEDKDSKGETWETFSFHRSAFRTNLKSLSRKIHPVSVHIFSLFFDALEGGEEKTKLKKK